MSVFFHGVNAAPSPAAASAPSATATSIASGGGMAGLQNQATATSDSIPPASSSSWSVTDDAFWRRPIGVEHVNWLIKVCGIVQENPIYSLRQCSSSLFVLLFQRLLNYPIPDLELEPNNHEKKLWNTRRVLEELSAVGETDLSYISATEIVNCNEEHISLLVRVFLHLALHLIQAQRMQAAGEGDSDDQRAAVHGMGMAGARSDLSDPYYHPHEPTVANAAPSSMTTQPQQPYFAPPPPLGAHPTAAVPAGGGGATAGYSTSASTPSPSRAHSSRPHRHADPSSVTNTSRSGVDAQRHADGGVIGYSASNNYNYNHEQHPSQWNAVDGGGQPYPPHAVAQPQQQSFYAPYAAAHPYSSGMHAADPITGTGTGVPTAYHKKTTGTPSSDATADDDSATFTNDLVASWQQEVVPPPRRAKGALVDPICSLEVQHRIEALERVANGMLQRAAVSPQLRRSVLRPDHGSRCHTLEEASVFSRKRAAAAAENAIRDAKIAALQAGRRQRDVQQRYLREAVREQSLRERDLLQDLKQHRALQRQVLHEEKARLREEEQRMVAAVDALVASDCRVLADQGRLQRLRSASSSIAVSRPSEATLRLLKDHAAAARETRRMAHETKRAENWEGRRILTSYQSQVSSWRRSPSVC